MECGEPRTKVIPAPTLYTELGRQAETVLNNFCIYIVNS